jgi:hypothetical protein
MPDATSVLNEISGALSSLATQIQSLFPESPSFAEIWNWQQPGITRDDLFDRVQHTISGINLIEDKTEVNQQIFDRLSRYPATISFVQSNTLPNSASENSYFGYISIVSMLDAIDLLTVSLRPKEPDWQEIQDKNLFPAQLKKRLDTLNRGITNVEGQTSNLAAKIQIINEAHQAANALPASLAGLEDARTKFELSGKEITAIRLNVDESHQDIAIYKDNIEKLLFISKELTANIDSVYSAATRQGLGKSFQERADSLKNSTYTLMFILAICLAVAGKISHDRIKVVEQLLALTAVGVAAPIWFAWLLTRQISQRFRLAEDYGFKASVAKAYEGYRREAQEIGNLELQTRLLSIALDRVQEDPLKQLEREESSSPIHDLISKLARSRGSNAESNGEKA